MGIQLQRAFFNHNGKYSHLPEKPSDEEIRDHLEESPLGDIIVSEKNLGNMEILRTFAYNAYQDPFHSCRGMSFAMYATAGQGKSYIVRQFAKTIGIPFVFVQADILGNTTDLFEMIQQEFANSGNPLVEVERLRYILPPCIVFMDEAHSLKKSLMKGGLLNAMEYNDGKMKVVSGKGQNTEIAEVDCHQVCWVGATTEEGTLFPPFASRLETTINWHSAGPVEIAKIISLHFPHFPDEACNAVSHYRRVPRLAIAFARFMELTKNEDKCDWKAAAEQAAIHMGIDKFGMPHREVGVLKALGQRPIAKTNLAVAVGCNSEALERIILPPLLSYDGNGPYVVPTHRGYALTEAGLRELDKRSISNRGKEVTVEHLEAVKAGQ